MFHIILFRYNYCACSSDWCLLATVRLGLVLPIMDVQWQRLMFIAVGIPGKLVSTRLALCMFGHPFYFFDTLSLFSRPLVRSAEKKTESRESREKY